MDEVEKEIRRSFVVQGDWCEKLASPFTALVCRTFAEQLDKSTSFGKSVLEWPGKPDALNDALMLRIAGVFHALAKRGTYPNLTSLYPPNPLPSKEQLWSVLSEVIAEEERELAQWLQWAPQTNEVARSMALNAGLMTLGLETQLPLSLLEVGSSAGLNLFPDRFHYQYDGKSYGNLDSKVVLQPAWQGRLPPSFNYEVIGRRGVDLNPLDVSNPQDQERLRSYVWPDQADRQARVSAAIQIAAADPPLLDKGDAAAWVENNVQPKGGQVSVLMHSIAFQYFPPESQDRIFDHMAKAGKSASNEAPLAWLRYEIDPAYDNRASLKLTFWPTGEERVLLVGDPHCRSLEWIR